jgi:hypothetical protein
LASGYNDGVDEERRRSIRHRTLKGGTIVYNNEASTLTCLVRNISDSGARLEVENSLAVPATFTLKFSDGRALACSIAWRREKAIGVTFDHSAASEPHD